MGHKSGSGITTGGYNVAIGYEAFDGTNTGSGNVAIGWSAGGDGANTGGEAVYVGRLAGYAVTSANHNVLIGMSAGRAITTNANNTIIGSYAGDAITGQGNTIVGAFAATSTSGADAERNTIVGNYAAGALTTGDKNIIIGDYSGKNISTGSNNVIIGGDINAESATADDQLLIASGDGSPTWIQGNSDGVVVGALTPLFYERAAMDTSAVDFRVPTVQSSTANPNGYPMPFAGTVLAASFLFTVTIADDSNTNTIRIRKNGGSSGGDIQEFTFTGGDLLHPNANTLVKTGLTFSFSAGDILQVKRQSGATDLNNAQCILWVQYKLW